MKGLLIVTVSFEYLGSGGGHIIGTKVKVEEVSDCSVKAGGEVQTKLRKVPDRGETIVSAALVREDLTSSVIHENQTVARVPADSTQLIGGGG